MVFCKFFEDMTPDTKYWLALAFIVLIAFIAILFYFFEAAKLQLESAHSIRMVLEESGLSLLLTR